MNDELLLLFMIWIMNDKIIILIISESVSHLAAVSNYPAMDFAQVY